MDLCHGHFSMNTMIRLSFLLAGWIAPSLLMLAHAQEARPEKSFEYTASLKLTLKNKCYSCHGGLAQEGGLRLDTVALIKQGGDSGPAIDEKSPLESLILQRVQATDDDFRMPPDGEPFTADQIESLKRWIKAGAVGPENETPQHDPGSHWAYQPISSEISNSDKSLDEWIDQRLTASGLTRSPRAEPITLVRRLYLDLHGLPPTPAQIDNFLQDTSSEGWRSLVEDVLSSPRYGERWAQHWLDVVRYADTHGYEVNTPRPNAWPYRDYVIRSFNDDLPYDQFIREQLAGDAFGTHEATGFLVAAPVLLPGQIGADDASKRLARQDALDEIIVGTGATFLGMTIGCARCHDHKFDPIPQTDYYSLQAFFAGVDYGDRPWTGLESADRAKQAADLQPQIDELEAKLRSQEPKAVTRRTVVIDDEDLDRVTLLKEKNGHGANPQGTQQGYRDDPGDQQRFANISKGRYTWWDNHPGEDVFTWNPEVTGKYRLWISWGVHGSGVHTRDARYVLDRDGDLATVKDQVEIARADQYYFVGQTEGESERKPLWSGLLDAGMHDWTPETRLVLRGGETQTGITADVIVLQECETETAVSKDPSTDQPAFRGPVNAKLNVESFQPHSAKFIRFTVLDTNENNLREPCIDELEVFRSGVDAKNIGLATSGTVATSSGNYSETGIHQLKHINDGRYGNSQSWISNEVGGGWVQLEFAQVEIIDRIQWGRDRQEKFSDRLAVNYIIESSMDGTQWTPIATSMDRVLPGTPFDPVAYLLRHHSVVDQKAWKEQADSLQSLKEKKEQLLKPRMVYAGKFREPDITFVLNRGDAEQPTDRIGPAFPSILGGDLLDLELPERDRRLKLAQWIASEDNPLTARVMVNRVWQSHFGIGLVETSSDFGLNGALPSHPELLDWLASCFLSNRWSLKELHRQILLSETYQQSHQIHERGMQVDKDCRLLWRFPSRRLEGEAIRDSLLAVNGQLNLEMGGPGFDFFKTRGGLSGFPPVESFTAAQMRRMIYAHKIRMEPVPVFGAFDCPDAGQAMPRRSSSTTAIQALNLFNSPFVADQANKFAERVIKEHPDSLTKQIDRIFLLALGRAPDATEKEASLEVAHQHGVHTVCRVLFNSNEFLFLP